MSEDIERLICCALIRDGVTHKGFRSHADLRGKLGDEDPYTPNPDDIEGFLTSNDRFVGRGAAAVIAFDAGQVRVSMGRPLLSSDVDWDGKPVARKNIYPGGAPPYEKQKSASLQKLLRK
jgi:hypothetical protein